MTFAGGGWDGSAAEGKRSLERAVATFRQLGDGHGVAVALQLLGGGAWQDGDYDTAHRLAEEVLPLARETGQALLIAATLLRLAESARLRGDYERAGEWYEEQLTLARQLSLRPAPPLGNTNHAFVALHQGNLARATEICRRSLETREREATDHSASYVLVLAGAIAQVTARPAAAVRLLGAVTSLLERIDRRLDPPDQMEHERYLAAAPEAFDAAWAEGQTMTRPEAVNYALETLSVHAGT